MAYVSLYRKYRSQTFSDLIGQDHVVKTLQNGIASERIAHSYLFTGPRGTGKTSSARLLAKALCCEKGPTAEPCNECSICLSITDGTCIDVFEMDAASESGVEDVRDTIVQVVEYRPAIARFKVFIIDEVHDLSTKAFDALLKTIEEPPAHIIFILATTEFNKVPPTIRSRCQKFEFHRASLHDLISRLDYVAQCENVEVEPAALSAIARMADGGYRDALTLLEQAILTSDGKVTLQGVYDQLGMVGEEVADEIILSIKLNKVPRLMELLAELARLGRDPRSILESLLYRIADLNRAVYGLEVGSTSDAARGASAHEAAVQIGADSMLAIRSALAEAHKVIRDISLPRLWLESELIRVAQIVNGPPVAVARAVSEQRAVAAEPAVKPKPVDKPKIEAVQAEPTNGKHEATPETLKPSGDPVLDELRGAWQKMYLELSRYASIQNKLGSAELVSYTEEAVIVEIRNVDLEWAEKPNHLSQFVESFRKHSNSQRLVKFIARKARAPEAEPGAVELPAEGQKLDKMAREIFGS